MCFKLRESGVRYILIIIMSIWLCTTSLVQAAPLRADVTNGYLYRLDYQGDMNASFMQNLKSSGIHVVGRDKNNNWIVSSVSDATTKPVSIQGNTYNISPLGAENKFSSSVSRGLYSKHSKDGKGNVLLIVQFRSGISEADARNILSNKVNEVLSYTASINSFVVAMPANRIALCFQPA